MINLKHIPNIITSVRIILTIILIFIHPPMGVASFVVYCIAGLTDMIDGPLARRIPEGKSKIGTELDSFADMFLIIVGVFVLLPAMELWNWIWPVVIGALSFKIVSASLSGLIKHRQVLFTHTIANKLAALFLFIAPILYFFGGSTMVNFYAIFLIFWVFLATFEEALINLLLNKPNANIRGIWKVKSENIQQRGPVYIN